MHSTPQSDHSPPVGNKSQNNGVFPHTSGLDFRLPEELLRKSSIDSRSFPIKTTLNYARDNQLMLEDQLKPKLTAAVSDSPRGYLKKKG